MTLVEIIGNQTVRITVLEMQLQSQQQQLAELETLNKELSKQLANQEAEDMKKEPPPAPILLPER